MSEWQPIETAPKDGNYFIAWDDHFGQLLVTMHWSNDGWMTEAEAWSGSFTHWMPLPDQPVKDQT